LTTRTADGTVQGMGAGVLDIGERLAVLTRAAALLASSADFESTLPQTIAACLPSLGDFGFFDLRVGDDEVVRTARAHEDARIEAILRPTQWVQQDRADLNLCALSTGAVALHPVTDDAWYQAIAVNDVHLDILRSLAFTSMLSVPLRYRGELIGALTLFFGTSRRRYTTEHVAFAEELAQLVAPIVVTARLVERQRRVEDALRLSEERLRLAISAGQLGTWDWNIVTNEIMWSERVYELHGLPYGSFGGRVEDFARLVHEDDRVRLKQAVADAVREGDRYGTEYRTVVDGKIRWLATRANVIRDPAGQPLRMVGANYDITDRVELLAAERAGRERLELLARAGEVLSSSLDRDATMHAIARAVVPIVVDWCRIDLVGDDGVARHVFTHHPDPELTRRAVLLAETFEAPPAVGSIAWVAANAQPFSFVFDRDTMLAGSSDPTTRFLHEIRLRSVVLVPLIARGRTIGVLSVLADDRRPRQLGPADVPLFTELAGRAALALDNARLYAEAERARRDAETANRAKDEFLAILGHELRNPLSPIVAALRLMELRRADSTRREREVIERQVAHLSRLVDDLLDVSRIARGKVEIARQRWDLRTIIDKAVEMTQPLFVQRKVEIELAVGNRPAWVDGDSIRLAQVTSNLLTNAAKFSQPGGRVTLTLHEREGMHELAVRDEGVGIDADLLPRVFNLFVQGPQTLERGHGGLGLGLAIVANLVELHDGRVAAESDGPGHGATFRVWLPRAPRARSSPTTLPTTTPEHRNARLLIVDDNEDAALSLGQLLRLAGFEVDIQVDGLEALHHAQQHAPDVAILDIGLPGIDGYELARRLRATPSLAHVRLIALTGYGLPADHARSEAAGFDRHLVKPVTPETIAASIAELLPG
jgi:PAS domain S-box-containing protein